MPSLKPFALVGGTALSLRYDHRSSIDLDLSFHEQFDHRQIVDELEATFQYSFVYKQQQTGFGVFCFINDIKVDFVYFPHPLIEEIEVVDNIRMYSNADNFYSGRGTSREVQSR
ncbi:MAG: nucleotidyl transferase AbiEii/AbiGii toxin family protein [Bacteroidales bacterium]|nr:nucleotidyl transferase AbiEii/AbiGii toxin family protein [Bacteroidales bacterium]